MQFMMKSDRKYQMSLEEIEHLIEASEQSNYKFDFVLTGGEPMLWNNLNAGLNLLRKSKITNNITMFSNAMFYEKLSKETIDLLTSIRISHYFYNDKHIKEFKQKYPDKVAVVDRVKFWANPDQPISNSLPCECLNPEILYYNYHVYACPHSLSIAQHNGSTVPLANKISKNFMHGLKEIKANQAKEICTMCISNKKVRDVVEKVTNTSKGKEDISKWGYDPSKELIQIQVKKIKMS
jgi:hypothetical protein